MENDKYEPVNSDDEKKIMNNGDVEAHEDDVCEEDEAKMRLTGNEDSSTKIQFSNSNHDGIADGKKDPVITIHDLKPEFSGMNKEELMKYVNDPFWIRLRWFLFILFWVVWIAMIVGAVVIVVLAPRCPPPPERQWWQKGSMYQVYTRSFKDSDADGNGDLKGIIQKLDYIKDIGVNTLILSSFYKSDDDSDSISNYIAVDNMYGSMEDFDTLVKEVKERDLHLVLDFIPNHSGLNHKWFKSSSNPNDEEHEKYKDYYVWANGKGGIEPNNWRNYYYGSAWEWNKERQQYYFHKFLPSQPDLNLRNEAVRAELKDVLKFWLDKGVDGFRINDVTHLFESNNKKDEEKNTDWSGQDNNEYNYWNHENTENQPEIFDLLQEWREVLDQYDSNGNKILIAESNEQADKLIGYYKNENSSLADIPTFTGLLNLKDNITGYLINDTIQSYYNLLDDDKLWPNWQIGNQDGSRVRSKYGLEMVDIMNMLITFLKGTPLTYYGEEIGMTDSTRKSVNTDSVAKFIELKKGRSAALDFTRSPFRNPMQWNNSESVGFTDGSSTWVPTSNQKNTSNVLFQKADDSSHLNIFKKVVGLREKPALLFGEIEFPVVTDQIFSVTRFKKGVPGFLLLINVGSSDANVDLSGKGKLPKAAIVNLPSSNLQNGDLSVKDKKVDLKELNIGPKQAVIFTFIPKA